jgi:hypothetical protein
MSGIVVATSPIIVYAHKVLMLIVCSVYFLSTWVFIYHELLIGGFFIVFNAHERRICFNFITGPINTSLIIFLIDWNQSTPIAATLGFLLA